MRRLAAIAWLAARKLARLVALRAWLEASLLETLETPGTPETLETLGMAWRGFATKSMNFSCKGNVDDVGLSSPIELFATKKAKSYL